MEEKYPTPIAVIGMGCRFPGGANGPDKLWELLLAGHSAWSPVPSDRWNEDSFYHPDIHARDANNHRGGHFLDCDISVFDAGFFGIQPSEANVVDPQQRLLLETAYEALESAGIRLEDIRGSNASVFVASFVRDYEMNIFKDTQGIPLYTMTGTGSAIIANRVSYVFDLKGASIALDTGCSGSLVALHQACQNLRAMESDMAFVGGTNLLLGPDVMQAMSLNRVLNDDGKCYTFDSRGAGYGRGEGVATIILKRLDDAIAAGDPIRAIICNTAVNQDGKTASITLPDQNAQEALIHKAYGDAGINPQDTLYVEAHGTGTVAGDTIEIAALANTFCSNRNKPLFVGSIKTNLGHLESASGLASVIKTILVLEKGLIPPNLNFKVPKDGLLLGKRNIAVPTKVESWPEFEIRRASVNSFGYGGTNAHVILEYPINKGYNRFRLDGIKNSSSSLYMNGQSNDVQNGLTSGTPNGVRNGLTNGHTLSKIGTPKLFVVSAKSKSSLSSIVNNLRKWVDIHGGDDVCLKDLAFTLSSRRSLMQWRSSFVARTREELVSKLAQFKVTKEAPDTRIGFLFTGQGAQWFAMGRELISVKSVFKKSLAKSEIILNDLGASWSLIKELLQDGQTTLVDRSDISQPITTALQIALVDLLESLNITPQAVTGHSSGEIAAAYSAGILTHEAALKVAYYRGKTAESCRRVMGAKGAMLAVGIGEAEILKYIAQIKTGIAVVACINSPSSTTISGDVSAIDELKLMLDNSNSTVFYRKLNVDTAYHSDHMKLVSEGYLKSLECLKTAKPRASVKFFSSVTGKDKCSEFGASYWVDNLVSKVRYSDALQTMCKAMQAGALATTEHLLIELGPHSALSGPTRQTIKHQNLEPFKSIYIPTLLRRENAIQTMLDLCGKLFELGYGVNLEVANSVASNDSSNVIIDLPSYTWDHSTSYWSESRLSKEHRLRQYPNHDILGLRIIESATLEPCWRNILGLDRLPWLRDHVVDNMIVFPGSGYMCMALEAVRQINLDRQTRGKPLNYRMRDVTFSKALVVPDTGTVEIQFTLKPERNVGSWETFKVMSRLENGAWSEHCHGSIMTEFASSVDEVEGTREEEISIKTRREQINKLKQTCHVGMDSKSLYNSLQANGNSYGGSFAAMKELHFGEKEAFGIVQIPDVAAVMPFNFMSQYPIHPATLDAVFHIDVALFARHCSAKGVMPTLLGEVVVSASLITIPKEDLLVTSLIYPEGPRSATFDCNVFQIGMDSEFKPVISVLGGELRAIGQTQNSVAVIPFENRFCYQIDWKPDVDFVPSIGLTTHITESAPVEALSPEAKINLLETVASLYIIQCLDDVDREAVVIPESCHILLLEWMRRYRSSEECQIILNKAGASSVLTYLKDLEGTGPEVELLSNIGSKLFSIVTGQVEALSTMLEGDSLTRFYASNMWAVQCHSHMANYLKLASFKNPHMKVLEVGAGTGSATVPLLEAFTHEDGILLEKFTFTDVSSAFFEKVQPLLSDWIDVVEFKTLDIETDPTKQGFTESSYDIVMASIALHATSSISTTLSNVRKLLKPGGRLILIELTRVTAWVNCVFGTVPGWWAGSGEGRIDSPLLSVKQWEEAFIKAGFGPFEITTDVLDGRASMMISTVSLQHENVVMLQNGATVLNTVKILHPDMMMDENKAFEKFASDFCSSIQGKGIKASFSSWPSDVIDKNATYVVLDDGSKPLLVNPTPERFHQITFLLTAGASVIWLLVQEGVVAIDNPEKGLLTGLERVARAESGSSSFQTINVQQSIADDCSSLVEIVSSLFLSSHQTSPYQIRGVEPEYIYRNNQLLIPRCVRSIKFNNWLHENKRKVEMTRFRQSERSLKLQVETPGLLDSIVFVDDESIQMPLAPDELELKTEAFGVNFKDVYIALGQMKPVDRFVGECSGIVTAVGDNHKDQFHVGDRICAWYATPFASRARVSGQRAHILPDSLSFAEGASIPIVFMTAYHALIEIARLKKGQTVLIHAASGGVGQAAIMIAKNVGAEIFATVSSVSKCQMIIDRFEIPESHIFSSKARNFKTGVLRLTKGKGVDAVLNSLSGDALIDSLSCIARMGTFVEIGKSDIYQNSHISLAPFARTVTFAAFDLSVITEDRPQKLCEMMTKILSMFEEGSLETVQPVNRMPITNIEDAFRLIQGRKHIGKLVLEVNEQTTVKSLSMKRIPMCSDEATIIIAGGLGDLGRNISFFLARRGAKHIVSLSRRTFETDAVRKFKEDLLAIGTEFHTIICDITSLSQVQSAATFCREKLPPVNAIIQAAMVLEDGVVEQMTLENFEAAVRPKFIGTRNLAECFESDSLHSFVMLSSITSVVGNRGQGNYAAGCAYQDALAHTRLTSKTHFISLNLPLIAGSDIDSENPRRRQSMYRQGVVPIALEELFTLLDYSLSERSKSDEYAQLLAGLDGKALTYSLDQFGSVNPMFIHLMAKNEKDATRGETYNRTNAHIGITENLNMEEIHERLTTSIANKLSALVAVNYEEINSDIPISEFGLDSLIAIELKNWIARTFQSHMETSEVIGMQSIRALANLTIQRSALFNPRATHSNEGASIAIKEDIPDHQHKCCRRAKKIQTLPLLNLETIMQYYLENSRHLWTDEEYENTLKAIEEFQEPGGVGQKLYGRLVARKNDPSIENWSLEIMNRTLYLDRRYSLVKSNIGGSHQLVDIAHSQPERAAVIALAAFKFQRELESGTLEPDYLNEQPLCMRGHEWLFNTCREPRIGVDKANKYLSSDYIVILYRGHVFKVSLKENGSVVSYSKLKATFEAIVNTVTDDSWTSIFTTYERNSWAKIYGILNSDPINAETIRIIAESCFIICLDDSSPTTPKERMDSFLLGNGFNRWFDKTVEFIVCRNGVSGFLGEHSMVDGTTMASINKVIVKAIQDHKPDSLITGSSKNYDNEILLQEYIFHTSSEIESEIERARKEHLATIAPVEYSCLVYPDFGSSLLESHRLPPKSGWEVIVQLATRFFFGYNPASWQAVSMEQYHQGRPDIIQVATAPVIEFCDAAVNGSSRQNLRKLFYKASKDHANAVTRAQRGHAYDRTFTALEWVRHDDEPEPTLFATDVAWRKVRPCKIMTGIKTEMFSEVGFVLTDPESIWMVYHIMDGSVRFSIVNAGRKADGFCNCISRAAEIIKSFLG